jgi:hypothetical protein
MDRQLDKAVEVLRAKLAKQRRPPELRPSLLPWPVKAVVFDR